MAKAHFGMIGLGTMGRNFLLNIAEHGISGVGYDLDAGKRQLLLDEGKGMPLAVGDSLEDFLSKLESPRNIMLLVPAGPIVDTVIGQLAPLLDEDDLIIDGGNSHFTDTDRRIAELDAKNIGFMGIGVSGGENGARHGASIMAGGKREYYDRIASVLETAAMDFNRPCAGYVGSGSAGHFVKMVHNGIEYAMMQQIAEVYDYMRRVLKLNIVRTRKAFYNWAEDGELHSYLISITKDILGKYDMEVREPLVHLILDTAGQKGTGKWTSQVAMDLGVPIPTIDSAVTMRQISAQKKRREEIALLYQMPTNGYNVQPKVQLEEVHDALYCGFILAYEQGFAVLRAANEEFKYGIDLREVAEIWRMGSIIWSSVLVKIADVFKTDSNKSLLLDEHFADVLYKNMPALRKLVSSAALCRIPAMSLAASANYYSAFRTERLPANLIQAQRDYFGAHTYLRTDKEGTFHTPDWDEPTYAIDPDDD